jgi:hypothetical protein
MDTGEALELVLKMAREWNKQGYVLGTPHNTKEALDTVEDFIVNNFEEED